MDSLFNSLFNQTTKKTPNFRTTVYRFHGWPVGDSPQKYPVNRKACPYDSDVLLSVSTTRRRVLLLTHGWPGSVWEFVKVLPLLTDPPNPEDAFEVICPSIPGFGFSEAPKKRGKSITHLTWPRIISLTVYGLIVEFLWKSFCANVVSYYPIGSQWKRLDKTTAELLWHMHNCDSIWSLFLHVRCVFTWIMSLSTVCEKETRLKNVHELVIEVL